MFNNKQIAHVNYINIIYKSFIALHIEQINLKKKTIPKLTKYCGKPPSIILNEEENQPKKKMINKYKIFDVSFSTYKL